jgi:cyclin-dependent kinase 12/13
MSGGDGGFLSSADFIEKSAKIGLCAINSFRKKAFHLMGCLCSKGARDDANVTSENRTPKDDSAAALVSNDGGTTDLCAKIKESRAKPTGTSQPEKAAVDLDARISSDNIGDLRGLPSSEHVAAGWPAWLVNVAPKAVEGWLPRRANSFEKLAKVKLYIIKLTRCARIRLG